MKMKKFFNDDSDCEKIDHQWDDLSMSDNLFEKVDPQPDIYDNSKSFEWPFKFVQTDKVHSMICIYV